MKFGVVTFPGSLDDRDAARAVSTLSTVPCSPTTPASAAANRPAPP